MNETAVCLLVRGHPPREVLLGLKKNGFGQGKLVAFGGKIEPGEEPWQAAVRELREETGVTVRREDLEEAGRITFAFPARPEWDIAIHLFCAHRWDGTPAESEEMRAGWFAVSAIPYAAMWDDARYWLPQVLAGQRIEARFVYGDDNETVIEHHVEER